MPQIAYKSIAPAGKIRRGVRKVASVEELEEQLTKSGEILLEAIPHRARKFSAFQSVPKRDLIEFTNQLTMLYESSVPLAIGLMDIADDVQSTYFRTVIRQIHELVSDGQSLADAMARYPKVFPAAYVSVVVSGQESGKLGVVLDRTAKSMEWRQEVLSTVRGALIYPAMLMVAIGGLLTLIVTFLVPRLAQVFLDADVELPALTRALLATSDFVLGNWPTLSIAFGILVIGPIIALRTRTGKLWIDWLLLKLPIFGSMIEMGATAGFADLLGLLVNAGVPIVRALEICQETVKNSAIRTAIDGVRRKVLDGNTLTEALRGSNIFPSLLLRMVSIGEQSGRTVEALEKVSAHYDKEVPRKVKRFTGLMEPLLTIFGGGAVAVAIFAGFLPIVKLMTALRGA